MVKKNTIILLTCLALLTICACGLTQSSLSETKQENSQIHSNKPLVVDQVISNNTVQNNGPGSNRANYKPKDGYVPDEQTAISIAVAVWTPIYGKDKIENEKPFKAQLKNGVWTVRGSLPENFDGGVAEADISKDDGRILRVIHGK
jgi:hypothetical protein